MVPQFRPQTGLLLIKKLLFNEAFSPLMPTNAKLETMNDEEFQKEMEHWVVEAQQAKYIDY